MHLTELFYPPNAGRRFTNSIVWDLQCIYMTIPRVLLSDTVLTAVQTRGLATDARSPCATVHARSVPVLRALG